MKYAFSNLELNFMNQPSTIPFIKDFDDVQNRSLPNPGVDVQSSKYDSFDISQRRISNFPIKSDLLDTEETVFELKNEKLEKKKSKTPN